MDIYTTQVLNRVVEQKPAPSSFLLDRFFPGVQTGDSEEIWFDIDKSKPRITPFVHPFVAGKVIADRGIETKSFKPAYAKDKRLLLPNQPLKRRAGETIGGSLSPAQRRAAQVNDSLDDQLDMLTRREEVMASEGLRLGQVTVAGENYPTVVVNFGRDAALTVTLAGGARWGEAGVSLIDNLETWAGLVQTKSGAAPREVVMDPLAWGIFRKDAEVKDLLDRWKRSMNEAGAPALDRGPMSRGDGADRARFVGMVGDFEIWVYSDVYVDEDGNDQKLWPDYTVMLAAGNGGRKGGLEGVRAYGAILDEKANYKAQRFFSKSWIEEDPPTRYLLLQSAPLVIPYRPNASFCATVR